MITVPGNYLKACIHVPVGFQRKLGAGRIRWLGFKGRMPWTKQRRAFPGRENSMVKGTELYSEKDKFYVVKTKSLGRRGGCRRGD